MDISKFEKIKRVMSFILNKIYYIGASLVIIALMFRFMDWKGSETMLIIGLFLEALIFFLGAFNNDEIDFKKGKNISYNNSEEEIIPANVFDKCDIKLSKYYSEINSDLKKINFKIQSFEMMQRLQDAFIEHNNGNSLAIRTSKTFNDMTDKMKDVVKRKYKKNNDKKKEVEVNKNEEVLIKSDTNAIVKRKRGRPRKNFNI